MLHIASRIYFSGVVDGFELVDLSTSGSSIGVLSDRIAAALMVISQNDNRLANRIRQDLKRFLISDAEGAEFIPAIRACMLSNHYVNRASADELAVVIVHESIHARLWTRGIRYSDDLRERIERLCVRHEIEFARRLPSADHLIADAEMRLDRFWWTKDNETARRLRQLKQLRGRHD